MKIACYQCNIDFVVPEGVSLDENLCPRCDAFKDLLAACEAGGRYSNALKKHQEAGTVGAVEGSDELEFLFGDWHNKTHAALAKAKPE
ncbi:hypothetical protein LCGC14_0322620 [marine sediment metagenome]|uniref:Uncharacterized protein n=1 Tax=marine sediment metagenome TaxID=412755 RepID=A0A0F9WQN0_9ZZZZ